MARRETGSGRGAAGGTRAGRSGKAASIPTPSIISIDEQQAFQPKKKKRKVEKIKSPFPKLDAPALTPGRHFPSDLFQASCTLLSPPLARPGPPLTNPFPFSLNTDPSAGQLYDKPCTPCLMLNHCSLSLTASHSLPFPLSALHFLSLPFTLPLSAFHSFSLCPSFFLSLAFTLPLSALHSSPLFTPPPLFNPLSFSFRPYIYLPTYQPLHSPSSLFSIRPTPSSSPFPPFSFIYSFPSLNPSIPFSPPLFSPSLAQSITPSLCSSIILFFLASLPFFLYYSPPSAIFPSLIIATFLSFLSTIFIFTSLLLSLSTYLLLSLSFSLLPSLSSFPFLSVCATPDHCTLSQQYPACPQPPKKVTWQQSEDAGHLATSTKSMAKRRSVDAALVGNQSQGISSPDDHLTDWAGRLQCQILALVINIQSQLVSLSVPRGPTLTECQRKLTGLRETNSGTAVEKVQGGSG
ncbi:hypothetical protein C7M84_021444 [Penaeus vannamei]|uniref:Uncharacterized protein n=1 Tax=Penaeus vannamei TaxID=6689 RepID=A0A423S9I8_PENVA|nr:hypothetical protein C7M84_021444 [Penaeus vannamei]